VNSCKAPVCAGSTLRDCRGGGAVLSRTTISDRGGVVLCCEHSVRGGSLKPNPRTHHEERFAMKKLVALLFALALTCSLASAQDKDDKGEKKEKEKKEMKEGKKEKKHHKKHHDKHDKKDKDDKMEDKH
jgi:hypothetical protein